MRGKVGGGILIAGTGSGVGKSSVCAGLCRALARRGLRVAPFKAQNMSLHSAVTPDGGEIGRAQAAQAAAAGIVPTTAMNPILLKPAGEHHSQVVVHGRPLADLDARDYRGRTAQLMPIVLEALASLRDEYDLVVCEGAGSLAEINIRDADLVNLGLARRAQLPVVVVGDIDRGGVFASLAGSFALLAPDDQRLVAGYLINKFRGDECVLRPGIDALAAMTGRPTLGVLPWRPGAWLDLEDSLALVAPREPPVPPLGRDRIDVAVITLRWMSNVTDVEALVSEPGVVVRFTESPNDVRRCDLVIVPGTKATVDDLGLLRQRGLDEALRERAAHGRPVLAFCGGYQMLGTSIVDSVESGAGQVDGLGLLPVATVFQAEKTVRQVSGTAVAFGGVPAAGYEIHHGVTARHGGEPLLTTAGRDEGCRAGAVLGTSWHGLLESDALRRRLLQWVAAGQRLDWEAGSRPFAAVREQRLDQWADLVTEHTDVDALIALARRGAPRT